ncbi:MAG: Eco57I restriction-modification methylase domain-containing protein [Blautia sp.]|nr:Eco57I restriction-modification methylase domain-containing protein [Blautia sp.]
MHSCGVSGKKSGDQVPSENSQYDRYKSAKNYFILEIAKEKQTNIFRDNMPSDILKKILGYLLPLSDHLIYEKDFRPEDFGYIFEVFVNKESLVEDKNVLIDNENRKDEGMFCSDIHMAHFISKQIIMDIKKENKSSFTMIDPSMGGGVFIYSFLSNIQEYLDNRELKNCIEQSIYGIDKNELAVDYFLAFLALDYRHLGLRFEVLKKHFVALDSLLLCSDKTCNSWNFLFPQVFKEGGFDYVVGNPPWGRIKANLREYNLLHMDMTADFQGNSLKREIQKNKKFVHDWENYRKYIGSYSEKLKESTDYSHQKYEVDGNLTGGDSDLYKYFVELGYKLLKKDGILGYIIPASFYMAESATGLRHLLLENGNICYLLNFENKKKIFPIHTSYKFIILIYKKTGQAGKVEKAAFNLTELSVLEADLNKAIHMVSYTRQFLKKCSGDYWTIPECTSIFEQNLLKKMYCQYPMLKTKRRDLWSVTFNRELDMTTDSGQFVEKDNANRKDLIPVYEGRMINQYDSSQKIYISGAGRKAVWRENNNKKNVISHYYVDRQMNKFQYYRACYCDITGQKNVRTILSSLIMPDALCGNKVPTCRFFPDNSIFYHLLWIGLSNSFVIDWIMRKKMTITLNFYHWNQIPFPRLNSNDENALIIATAAAVILEKTNSFDLKLAIQEETSNLFMQRYIANRGRSIDALRLEIDTTVAKLYNLGLEDLAVIMMDFPGIDALKEGIVGDKRLGTNKKTSFVTRDSILYAYAKICGLEDVDLKLLYSKHGEEILVTIGEIYILQERIRYYEEKNIMPY